jgi:hypothetical protein
VSEPRARAGRAAAPRRASLTAVRAAGLGLLPLVALLGGACGERFDLPPQPDYQLPIPEPGTFNLKGVWSVPEPTDLALSGLYIFVIEEHTRVRAYFSTRSSPSPPPWVSPYEGLIAPVQVAACKRDTLFVIVADAGDMHCKIYNYLGGPPLHTFTDTLWVELSGLAADGDLNIYVADAARDTIQSYDRWGRRVRVVSDYGTGSGYVIDPHGLAHNGHMLIVADTGKNWVQRLRPDTTDIAAIAEPIGRQEGLLLAPWDVASDSRGEFIYVADTGHDRVLQFQTTGDFGDTVYSPEKIPLDSALVAPRFVCGEDSLVFVSDPAGDRIVLLELKAD